MDLRQLRYFVTLAAERNFNKAAQRLNMAQPPLSRSIQQMEAEFGTELIDRSTRPLSLTSSGHLLYEQAILLLRRAEDMQVMMRSASNSGRQRFTIGFVASTIYARLPALIREFRAEMPNVDLALVESTSLDQMTALKDGRIDVGFGRIRFDDPAVRRTVLRREPLVVAVPAASHWGSDGARVSLASLVCERLILYPSAPRPSYADQVLSLFRDHDLDPAAMVDARELQIAIGLVAAEEGIAIVPESVRRSRNEDVRYVELAEAATSPIIMSYRQADLSPQLAQLKRIIARKYKEWGYDVPDALMTESRIGTKAAERFTHET